MIALGPCGSSFLPSPVDADSPRIGAKEGLGLPNTNFDTGAPSKFGEYKMADEACGKLLIKLKDHKFEGVDADLRHSLLDYYGSAAPVDAKAAAALAELRMQPGQ